MNEDGGRDINELISTLEEALERARGLRRTQKYEGGESGTELPPKVERKSQTSATIVHVYWIGAGGLATAARALGDDRRIDRIGCTTEIDLETRLTTAGKDAYGAWEMVAGNPVKRPGFERWVMQAIATTRASKDPSITVKTRSLMVELPKGMTRRAFDRALHQNLVEWSLPKTHARFTLYSVGVDRLSRAIELYTGLDPRRDGDKLLGIVERILIRHRMTNSGRAKSPHEGMQRRSTEHRKKSSR